MIASEPKANGLTLRSSATHPGLASFAEVYGLRAACIAVYPMYRGVSQLVGMEIVDFAGGTPEDEFEALARAWNDFDFFFIHIKKTDSKGEDGNFGGKSAFIETVDAALPRLLELNPDVLMITGDHSTPARMRTHSWHPIPFLLWAPETARPDIRRVLVSGAAPGVDSARAPQWIQCHWRWHMPYGWTNMEPERDSAYVPRAATGK